MGPGIVQQSHRTIHRTEAGHDSGPAGASPAALVALTRDAELFASLRMVLGDQQELIVVDREVELAEQLLTGRAAVALIDAAAAGTPLEPLITRLKAQFPDLVLVVAGDTQAQTALAPQVMSGAVYRFLHTPVSEQRVRLFVEAALRRHGEQKHQAAAPAQPPAPVHRAPPRTTIVAAGVAGALLLVFGAWYALRDGDRARAPVETAASDVPAAARPTSIPAAASRAEQMPSAAAPVDPRLAELDRLLAAAEQALARGRLEESERLVEAARRIDSDHVRVAFLGTQIGNERERRQRGEALRAQDLQRALDARVGEILQLAEKRSASGDLVEPARDSALFHIESAAALDPDSGAVAKARDALQLRLLRRATDAMAARELEAAERWIAAAATAGAGAEAVTSARRELQQTRISAEADRITRLSREFTQRVRDGALLEPIGESAETSFQELARAAPDHPATAQARRQLADALGAEARTAAGRGDLARAGTLQAAVADIDTRAGFAEALARDIEAARAAGGVVAASTLERTRYVAPQYPPAALRAGRTGWVDLEFTVAADGTVKDVRAVRSEPGELFTEAAVEAVRRWRYRPVERAGTAVEQRARLRVRFEVSE